MSGAVMLTSMLRFTFGSPRDSLVAETGSCVALCHLHRTGSINVTQGRNVRGKLLPRPHLRKKCTHTWPSQTGRPLAIPCPIQLKVFVHHHNPEELSTAKKHWSHFALDKPGQETGESMDHKKI